MPKDFEFDRASRAPRMALPKGTCDAQFHVFGPPEVYPVRPGAAYEMPSATAEAAVKIHRRLGIERGVIVQSTIYGSDHLAVLDALSLMGPDYRGCANAIVFDDADDRYLAKLSDSRINGARFTFRAGLGPVSSERSFQRGIDRVRDLGWYAKIHPPATGILESALIFENVTVPVLIDHMGRPDAAAGPQAPNVQKTVELLRKGNFWVMLSLAEKISATGYPWHDVIPLARAFIQAAPDRCVWGTDWPHPMSPQPPPDDAALLDLLFAFTDTDEERRKILVDNPAALFGFPSPIEQS